MLLQRMRVLDLFSYTGGFAVAAGKGGAREVLLVDSSAPALERARTNLSLNQLSMPAEVFEADAFEFLRPAGAWQQQEMLPFDLIVADPPPLARKRGDVKRATRAYKDLAMHALRALAPGGELCFFACSQHVTPELLRQVLFGAAHDVGLSPRWLLSLEAPVDHAVSLDHPEGRYLSGALLQL